MRALLTSSLVFVVILSGFAALVRAPASLLVDPSVAHNQGNDLTRLYLPQQLKRAHAVHTFGRIPGWDPSGFGGRPLVGNPQAGLWYPPNWLIWWSRNPALLGWITLAHLALAALGTMVLARRVAGWEWSAAAAGAFVALNPYVLDRVMDGHVPHVWAACWIPWAFLAARLAWKGHKVGALALPVTLAMPLLAGHPQPGFLLVVGMIAFGVCASVRAVALAILNGGAADRDELARRLTSSGLLVLACLIAVLLTAVEWLPTALLRPFVVRDSRIALADTLPYSIHNSSFIHIVMPLFLESSPVTGQEPGQSEHVFRLGISAAALAFLGAVWTVLHKRERAWAWITLIALWLGMGAPFGLYAVFYHGMPGFDQLRVPSRALFLGMPAIAILIALGFRTLSAWPVARWAAWLLLLCELIMHAHHVVQTTPLEQIGHAGPLSKGAIDALARDHQRIRYSDRSRLEVDCARHAIESVDLYDRFQLQHAADLYRVLYSVAGKPRPVDLLDPLARWHRERAERAILDRMSVAWILDGDRAIPNPSPLPRAYVIGSAIVVPDESSAVEWLTWTDPRAGVLLSVDPLASHTQRSPFLPAEYSSANPDEVVVRVTTNAAGYLVVGDTWMPGWTATRNGSPTPIFCGNRAQRVVALPGAGPHEVIMRYEPPGLFLGGMITIATGLLWAGAAIACVVALDGRIKPNRAVCAATTPP